MIGVVALLGILTAGAIVGLMQQRSNTSMGKLLQCLSAVDQAKQSWQMFNPNAAFPSDEPSRWSAISVYLNTSAVQVISGKHLRVQRYNGFHPRPQYLVQINDINTPCQAQVVASGAATSITRPL